MSNKPHPGQWSDPLRSDEVELSNQAYKELCEISWAQPLVGDDKVRKALTYAINLPLGLSSNKDYDSIVNAKSAFFELRFARAILNAQCGCTYEFKTGVEKTSVDFKIKKPDEENSWLVELTTLRDSEAVKKATTQNGNTFTYTSSITTENIENAAEVVDIMRTQKAIVGKVYNADKGKPIKFPKIQSGQKDYHVIIIDMRGFNIGACDGFDCQNILYGSEYVARTQKEDAWALVRFWVNKDGRKEPVKGIFEAFCSHEGFEHLRERIHAVGFISEQSFLGNEMNRGYDNQGSQKDVGIKLFPNPLFYNVFQEIREKWPLFTSKPSIDAND
ncbi:MAG: hypothetical protein J0G29_03850 [Alphaproteobacteria bacterium]|nr:hypothetical protein [Alphaproteobacteria bacterium]OJV45237.1 MAG: hypothetical protein BGO28_00330 [Alphaproteobacteria bacterium 43-37]